MEDDESPAIGYKKRGQMCDSQRKARNSSIEAIKKEWNVESVVEIFPQAIRPANDDALGNNAISNIRSISMRVSKSAARALFIAECGDRPVGFSHTSRILKALVNDESPASSTKSFRNPTGKGSDLKKRTDLKDHEISPLPPKKAPVEKYPVPRIPKRTVTHNGATPIDNPSNSGPKKIASEVINLTDDDLQLPNPKSTTTQDHDLDQQPNPIPTQQPNLLPSPGILPDPYRAPTPPRNQSIGTNQSTTGIDKAMKLKHSNGTPFRGVTPINNQAQHMPVSGSSQHNGQLSAKGQTSMMISKEVSGNKSLVNNPLEPKGKALDGRIMTQDEKLAHNQRMIEELREKRRIRDQKFQALVETSSTSEESSISTPTSCPNESNMDIDAGRAVKAQSEGLVSTKRPYEEIADTIIVDTRKRIKASSVPLNLDINTPSSPSAAPIAPMIGPVKNSVSQPKPVNTTVLEKKKPLSSGTEAPVASMHTAPKPIPAQAQVPAPAPAQVLALAQSYPAQSLVTKKRAFGEVQLATTLEKSTSKAAKQANAGIRAIGRGITTAKKVGDDKGEAVIQELADLIHRNAAQLNADVQAFYEKHGLSIESGF